MNTQTTRPKATDRRKRAAKYVSEKVASGRSAAAKKVRRASKRAAAVASEKASTAGRAAVVKLVDQGIKASRKQQAALQKIKTRVSDR